MFAILAWVTWVWVFPSRSDGSSVWLTNFLIYSSGPKNGSSEILSTISQKNPQIGFRGIYQEFWEGKGDAWARSAQSSDPKGLKGHEGQTGQMDVPDPNLVHQTVRQTGPKTQRHGQCEPNPL